MMKGVWLWQQNIIDFGAEKVISYLKCAGFTDVFFLTKGLNGKAAFLSGICPHASERDLLRELIDSAHASGIRVHAWFTSASDDHYKSLHPESGRCHFKKGKDRGLISLKNADYLSYLKRIIKEMLLNYSVDGVHLDYIRYNHMLYGWDENDLLAYQKEGADIDLLKRYIEKAFYSDENPEFLFDAYKNGDKTLRAFANARRSDVTSFAQQIYSMIRKDHPEVMLSAAVMPEGAYASHEFSDLHYGQNYEDLSKMCDFLMPMAYSKAYDKTSDWVKGICEEMAERGIQTLIGIQAYDNFSSSLLHKDLYALNDTKTMGFCLFREGAFALAFSEDDGITIVNPLDFSLSSFELVYDSYSETISASLPRGDELHLSLNSIPEYIRSFDNNGEICVYFANDK